MRQTNARAEPGQLGWLVGVALLAAAWADTGSAGAVPVHASGTRLPLIGYSDMVVDNAHGHVFVSGDPDANNNSVVVVDFEGTVVAEIEGLDRAAGMAIDAPSNRLYVALKWADAIAVVDTVSLVEIDRLPLGTKNGCPESMALAAGLVWFGFTCGNGYDAGLGSVDPATGLVRTYTSAEDPHYRPILGSGGKEGRFLVASDADLSPATLYEYSIDAEEKARLRLSVFAPGYWASNMSDLAVTADQRDVVTPAGGTYFLQAFRISDLTQDGAYFTDAYPNSVVISADGTRVVGGRWFAGGADIFFFSRRDTPALAEFDLDLVSEAAPFLYDRGLAGSPSLDRVFVVSRDTYGEIAEFHVLVAGGIGR